MSDTELIPLVSAPHEQDLSAHYHHDDSHTAGQMFRAFVQLLVIVCCLFLLVRTIFIEPFGVTTGSMAYTLHGNNRQAGCPRCGYHVVVGSPTREDRLNPQVDADCPNCGHQPINLTEISSEVPGDRLLVDKLSYQFRKPRRWEMAVFHCPDDKEKPYVKRTIGLPGEAVKLFDGDVYINDELQRKPIEVIREMQIPIFDMNYPPDKIGWEPRWLVESFIPNLKLPKLHTPKPKPLVKIESIVQGSILHLDATTLGDASLGLTYRNRNLDTGTLDPIRDRNGFNGGVSQGKVCFVHDFIVNGEIEILAGTGVFSCRLYDGADSVTVDIPVETAENSGKTGLISHDGGTPSVTFTGQFTVGKRHKFEFAFVDRTAYLAIDGVTLGTPLEVALHMVPVAAKKKTQDQISQLSERRSVEQPLQLGIRGVSVKIRNLVISRDVHYRSEGKNATTTPYLLANNEYFMLGDNSPNSKDSREWEIPGVPEGRFIGKPFFIHQPLKVTGVKVNGREHRVRGLDWDRMKLSW